MVQVEMNAEVLFDRYGSTITIVSGRPGLVVASRRFAMSLLLQNTSSVTDVPMFNIG
jgi:hypothetical protein